MDAFLARARASAWLLLVPLFALTIARTLNDLEPYAVGHWLHSYKAGLIARGLPGTLIRPLLEYKGRREIERAVTYVSLAMLFSLAAALFWSARKALSRAEREGTFLLQLAAGLAFFTSPFVAVTGFAFGYFDQLLALALLGTVELLRREDYVAAGLVGALAMLCHELYLFYLPLLAWIAWFLLRPESSSPRRRLAALATFLTPPFAAFFALSYSRNHLSATRMRAVQDDIDSLKVLPPDEVKQATAHLRDTILHDLHHYGPRGLSRCFGEYSFFPNAPHLLVLLAVLALLLWQRRQLLAFVALIPAVVAPWAMHWVAVDQARIASFSVLLAYAAALTVPGSAAAPSRGTPSLYRVAGAVALVAACWSAIFSERRPLAPFGRRPWGERGVFQLHRPPK
jgi:hypothetical protein